MERTKFALKCTFDTKSTKSGADCDAAPHAKMYAARYPPHCAGPPAHVGGHDRLLSQPTFDAAADC